MRITESRITPVNIPLEAPLWWAGGLYPGTSKLILEVETDVGIVGLGEAPSTNLHTAVASMCERLKGCDPLDIAGCEERCVPPWQIVQNTDDSTAVRAFGSIELALWDIRGKAWNEPLYNLLGGAVRHEIPFTEYFGFRQDREMSPEDAVDYCLRMRETHGSSYFEGKLSLGDPRLEVRTVRLLREALGSNAVIRLDANMQYALPTAHRLLWELQPFDIRNYEDPVATFEELRLLRQHSSIPFSTHVPDIRRAVSLGVPDAIVVNLAVLGGVSRAVRFIGACEAMGVGLWWYSGDAGIATAAYLHMSASMPSIVEPSQSLCRWQVADVIENGPFRQTDRQRGQSP
jgi:glucarate dehydratase